MHPTYRCRHQSPPGDGLVVGIAMVPVVLASLFLLVERGTPRSVREEGARSVVGLEDGGEGGDGGVCSLEAAEGLFPMVSHGVIAGAPEARDEAHALLVYLEALLDGSLLCASSEVSRWVQAAGTVRLAELGGLFVCR